MPAVVRHPLRHLTQVRVAGVLECQAELLPAGAQHGARLHLLLRPQRGLPYVADVELDVDGERAVREELLHLQRGALVSVAGHGLELTQHAGQAALKLTHAWGLVIPH